MLIRLRVNGFKSLEQVDVRFGPMTILVGPNDSGKSNLLDAINFLSRLASAPAADAAAHARQSGAVLLDPASIFTRTAGGVADTMTLCADFIVSDSVVDDFGGQAAPASTALRYEVRLRRQGAGSSAICIDAESLTGIGSAELADQLGFSVSPQFLQSLHASKHAAVFMAMDGERPGTLAVTPEQAGGAELRTRLSGSARTFVSTCNTIDHPTVLAARREMQSWSVFRLDMGALRRSDVAGAPSRLAADGGHLPSVIERLHRSEALACRLAALKPRIAAVAVARDADGSKRFYIETTNGESLDAAAISDGTLRMLGLAAIAVDPERGGCMCIEEPENSLHPGAQRELLDLFAAAATDTAFAVGADNPLCQVVLVTHAPAIVQAAEIDDLLVAGTYNHAGAHLSRFSPLQGSWRARLSDSGARPVGFGALLGYLEAGASAAVDSSAPRPVLQAYRGMLKAPPTLAGER
jgi:predicted ATPase